MGAMDWSLLAESIWRLSIPLELVPDVAAWLFCGLGILYILWVIVIRRPRLCAFVSSSWLVWLGYQVSFKEGWRALDLTKRRGNVAIETTDKFAQHLLKLIRAWTDFFLPFLSDVCKWIAAIWRSLTVRQRLVAFFTILCGYAIFEVYRMFRRHERIVKLLFFHASFLIAGPIIWQLCGSLPQDWPPWCLSHLVTTFPTLVSLVVLATAEPPAEKETSWLRRSPSGTQHEVAASKSAGMHRLWLAYWSCYPIVALLEVGIDSLPRLAPYYSNAAALRTDLQRGFLVFVVWLQFWQGSHLVLLTMRSLVAYTNLFENLAWCLGSRGLKVLSFVRGGLTLGAPSLSNMRFFQRVVARFWLLCLVASVGGVVFAVLIWLFYRAVNFVSSIITMMLWCFAALDSADTLAHGAEKMLSKKLSFWVLATLWGAATNLPYVGLVLRLCTPFAFSIWLVAAEPVLRCILLPITKTIAAPIFSTVCALFASATEESTPADSEQNATQTDPPKQPVEMEPSGELPDSNQLPSAADGESPGAEGGPEEDTGSAGNAKDDTGGVGGANDGEALHLERSIEVNGGTGEASGDSPSPHSKGKSRSVRRTSRK